MELELTFKSNGDINSHGFSAYHLATFLRIFETLCILNKDFQEAGRADFKNIGSFEKKLLRDSLYRFVYNLDSILLFRPIGRGMENYTGYRLKLDTLYNDLIVSRGLRSPVYFNGISYNSPLKITIAGATAVLILSVSICGGTVEFDIDKDRAKGKVEMPGLITVVERVFDLVKESTGDDTHFGRDIDGRYLMPYGRGSFPTESQSHAVDEYIEDLSKKKI